MIWDFQSVCSFIQSGFRCIAPTALLFQLLHTNSRSIHRQSFSLVRPLGSWVFTEAIAFKCFTQGQLHRPLEGSTLMQQWSNCQNNQAALSFVPRLMHCVSSRCTLIKTLMGLLLQVQTFIRWTFLLSCFIDVIYKEFYSWDVIYPINMPFFIRNKCLKFIVATNYLDFVAPFEGAGWVFSFRMMED